MNWKLKAHGMAVLSRVPGGRYLYHRLQRLLGTNRLVPLEGVRRSLEVVDLISKAGANLAGTTVLEIGTGWRPFLPFVLALSGARRVITLDVNPWLTKAYALETYHALEPHLGLIADQLRVDPKELRDQFVTMGQNTHTLKEFLTAARIDYRYPGDATRTAQPDESVDFVCSSNVLEHVPAEVIRAMHAESLRILRPSGLVVHRFNPGDHFAGVDRSITGSNFLRFSDRQWKWYGGSGLSYHNRLRCRQHRDMLRTAGFAVLTETVRVDQRALEAIRSGALPIHPDFGAYTDEELAADYMWLVGRKPSPTIGKN